MYHTATPPAPTSAPTSAERIPPWAQTMISALLTLLTLPFYLVDPVPHLTFGSWTHYVAMTALQICFVVVLAVWGRDTRRRLGAVALAVGFLVLERIVALPAVVEFVRGHLGLPLVNVSAGFMLIAWIGGWSVARRQSPYAATALIVVVPYIALVSAFPGSLLYSTGSVIGYWASQTAAIVIGVAIVWAADVIARATGARRSTTPVGFPTGVAPYPYPPHPGWQPHPPAQMQPYGAHQTNPGWQQPANPGPQPGFGPSPAMPHPGPPPMPPQQAVDPSAPQPYPPQPPR
ncbi:hypothetical protein AAFP35_13355 [Gordonia sp. CPCC 206044]|uniref:hypothetical protein n=1 Tax=Gordonia sp. CPCC 206044 TaxID=3140793 RepID=UPI003AF38AF5